MQRIDVSDMTGYNLVNFQSKMEEVPIARAFYEAKV